jgi:hypothetical protein
MDRKTHYQCPDPEMQEVVIAALLMAAFGSLVGPGDKDFTPDEPDNRNVAAITAIYDCPARACVQIAIACSSPRSVCGGCAMSG